MTESTPPSGAIRVFSSRPEIADLQTVMELIGEQLTALAIAVPRHQRVLIPNALLNLGVERILAIEGPAATAAILRRLAALIHNGEQPRDGESFRLSGHDA